MPAVSIDVISNSVNRYKIEYYWLSERNTNLTKLWINYKTPVCTSLISTILKRTIFRYFEYLNTAGKVKFSVQQTITPWMRSRGTALFFRSLGARYGWVVKATLRPLYLREDLWFLLVKARWAPRPICAGLVNIKSLSSTRYQNPKKQSKEILSEYV